MKNAKNNHPFTIWKKVDFACSLCLKRIKLTKTSDITFLSQFNHHSTRRKENVIAKTISYWMIFCRENADFLPFQHTLCRGTRFESCLKAHCDHHPHYDTTDQVIMCAGSKGGEHNFIFTALFLILPNVLQSLTFILHTFSYRTYPNIKMFSSLGTFISSI